jgi:hypothetical protein
MHTFAQAPAVPPQSAKQRQITRFLAVLAILVALIIAMYGGVALWARHNLSAVEPIVALHTTMLARESLLYYDLNQYPFTVSPYGPVFYTASALLQNLGLPAYPSGRLITLAALLVSIWLVWRITAALEVHRYASYCAALLAAATATILNWGTVGQVDMLGCAFSLAAFCSMLEYRRRGRASQVVAAAVFVLLAIFTKQTMVASCAAIALSLLPHSRRTAVMWALSVAGWIAVIAYSLNAITGHYVANAFLANLNPFRLDKLWTHLIHFFSLNTPLFVLSAAGLPMARGKGRGPLYLYTLLALLVWLATAPKIGSDTNYQMETLLLLACCAGCTLDQYSFFPRWFAGRRQRAELLMVPLLGHIFLNAAVSCLVLYQRVAMQPLLEAEMQALKPYLTASRGKVLSVNMDSVLHLRGHLDVEPLIFTLLVQAGAADPEPVRRDLAARRIAPVVLHTDIFSPSELDHNPELGSLPPALLDQVRANYRLARHVPGAYLNGSYVYEPVAD